MPGYPVPNSQGNPQPDNAGGPGIGTLPHGKPGGEIIISRTEASALAALETELDKKRGFERARRETGLRAEQLRRLHARAEKARKDGYTLKGVNITLRPKNYPEETNALLGKTDEPDEIAKQEKRTGARTAKNPLGTVPVRPGLAASQKAVGGTKAQPAKKARESAVTGIRLREARAQWVRFHECDGDRMCGPCRMKQAMAREARMRKKRMVY